METEKPVFYICDRCKTVVGLVKNGGGKLECCGEKMRKLQPNTVEASVEKHIPVYTYEGKKLTVTVGSAEHPMLEEHHIEWICIMQNGKVQRQRLGSNEKPQATFYVDSIENLEIYEYCNIHGLWVNKA